MPLTNERTLLLKSVITGVLISVALIVILMCVVCAVFLFSSAPPAEYLDYIMIAIDGVAVFLGALIAAGIAKSGGLLTGLFTGLAVFIIIFAAGLCSGTETVTMLTPIRAAAVVILGIFGGIKGVNRKEKIHIKTKLLRRFKYFKYCWCCSNCR